MYFEVHTDTYLVIKRSIRKWSTDFNHTVYRRNHTAI